MKAPGRLKSWRGWKTAAWLGSGLAGLAAITSGIAVGLCEATVRPRRRTLRARQRKAAAALASRTGAMLLNVELTAEDGAALRAWYFRARLDAGRAVLVLHGQADNRAGSLGYAGLLLDHGFSVLCPDLRAHGESEGEVASYGCREANDVCRWVNWLKFEQRQSEVFALGESMGAAILLQALPLDPGIRAVVAESPFASLREIAYDRMGQAVGTGPWAGRTVLRPAIETGFLYGRLRYGIDLRDAAPESAMAEIRTPILLIHGEKDETIPLRHAERISAAGDDTLQYWAVPGTRHCRALARFPEEFERRVCGWFQRWSGR